jgi:hypothetical protein
LDSRRGQHLRFCLGVTYVTPNLSRVKALVYLAQNSSKDIALLFETI